MKRRSSVIGPLILIGIGIVFLLRNVYPEMNILEFLSRVWPWVLVGWGVLRLGELLFWKHEGRPLPAKGISGGEWFFIFLFSIFGSAANATLKLDNWMGIPGVRINGWDLGQESFEFPVNGKVASTKSPRFVIESFRGDAQIVGGDVEYVEVNGRKVIRADGESRAGEINLKTPMELVNQGDQIILRMNQQRVDDRRARHSARLEIVVPRGSSIEAHGRLGDFDIRDITGTVRIDSDNAGVRLENIGGDVVVETRRSDIIRAISLKNGLELRGRGEEIEIEKIAGTVTIAGTYSGTVQFRDLAKPVRYKGNELQFEAERVTGEVRTSVGNFFGENIVGPVRISAGRSYDVQLNNYTDSADIRLSRGNINLRPEQVPLGRMQIETGNGDIEVFMPEKAKFEIKAVAEKGEVRTDWGDALKMEEHNNGRKQVLEGNIGGGSKVSLESGRGTVNVWKRSGEVTSPTPPPAPPSAPAPKAPVVPPTRVE